MHPLRSEFCKTVTRECNKLHEALTPWFCVETFIHLVNTSLHDRIFREFYNSAIIWSFLRPDFELPCAYTWLHEMMRQLRRNWSFLMAINKRHGSTLLIIWNITFNILLGKTLKSIDCWEGRAFNESAALNFASSQESLCFVLHFSVMEWIILRRPHLASWSHSENRISPAPFEV